MRQQQVYDVLLCHPGFSNHDVLNYLRAMNPKKKFEASGVYPRITELRNLGLIVQNGFKKYPLTNRKCMTWRVLE